LGTGAFGVVVSAVDRVKDETIALKIVDVSS